MYKLNDAQQKFMELLASKSIKPDVLLGGRGGGGKKNDSMSKLDTSLANQKRDEMSLGMVY